MFGTAEKDPHAWTILTIGHLSMNKHWGETERRRGPLCTSTLVHTPAGLLLVDPSLMPPEMPKLLMDQAGVAAGEVAHVFVTHFHGDHRFGLDAFPDAAWWMAPEEIDYWRPRVAGPEADHLAKFGPAVPGFLPGMTPMPCPGHTPGTTALLFDWRGRKVAIAGDAVMTADFLRAREGFHNSTDPEMARTSIDMVVRDADIIIPGHDNYIPREMF
jgi:glyoxylase-like metal-dependent hydrolase (beta-lactamase superfamily II)